MLELLDGCYVKTTVDIVGANGQVIVPVGTTFKWSNDSDCQWINGESVYIEPSEVEL